MTFIVTPLLREALHSSCDIPIDFKDVLEEFKRLFPQDSLDTSLMDSRDSGSWFLEDLDLEAQKKIRNAQDH